MHQTLSQAQGPDTVGNRRGNTPARTDQTFPQQLWNEQTWSKQTHEIVTLTVCDEESKWGM